MNSIEKILNDAPSRRVAVVGDIMLDRYLFGSIDRISPEAPVPVVSLKSVSSMLGGAGNVAANLAGMGAKVALFGVIGDDSYGDEIEQLLDNKGIDRSGVIRGGNRTTAKTRIMSGGQHVLRVDDEETSAISADVESRILQSFMLYVAQKRSDGVILQDYNKGVLNPGLIAGLLSVARENRMATAVDPKAENFFDFVGVDIFKPNLKEIKARTPFEVTPEIESLNRASSYVRDKIQHRISCITLSDKGIYIDDSGVSGVYPTTTREIVDVCGAGDAVISMSMLGYLAGLSGAELAYVGNLAGGHVCSHPGVTALNAGMFEQG